MLIWAVYSQLRSSNCLNWNGYCNWVGVFFFFSFSFPFSFSMLRQPVQCVSWSQQLNLLKYTLLSPAFSFSSYFGCSVCWRGGKRVWHPHVSEHWLVPKRSSKLIAYRDDVSHCSGVHQVGFLMLYLIKPKLTAGLVWVLRDLTKGLQPILKWVNLV